MLNVVVIDDEKLVRAMLIRCINWEEIGLHIVGEAGSAKMGLELVEELKPDIVFMDVRMPSMDGLTCSRILLGKHPQIKVIILSGHDEFEYASEGIKIGVFDYLLKPINAKEIQKAAIKVRDAVIEERNHQAEFERFREELKKHSAYIADRQLGSFVRSQTPGQFLDSLAYFGIEIQEQAFQVALLEIRTEKEEISEEDKLLLKMHMKHMTEQYYSQKSHIYVFDSGNERITILNNLDETVFYETGADLKKYLENNASCTVSIGIGDFYTEMGKVSESYQEAKDALKYRFIYGDEDIICFRDIFPYYDTTIATGFKEGTIREFGNALRIADTDNARKQLELVFTHSRRTVQSRDEGMILAVELISEMMRILTELKIGEKDETLRYPKILEKVFSLETLDKIEEYLQALTAKVSRAIGAEVADKEQDLVQRVKIYIDENFKQESLSLNLLAKNQFVNASYLSRVFKEKTGTTFSNYIFEVRMQQAAALLRDTDLKAYEVAEQVGISDPHYFSSCFKKYTGNSVSEYKKKQLHS